MKKLLAIVSVMLLLTVACKEEAVEAVVEEDVGKAGRQDGAKAVLVQRPGRVLP